MKPILINGFQRSGTTYLYLQLYKNFKKVLYEPLCPCLGQIINRILKNIRDLSFLQSTHWFLQYEDRISLFEPYLKYFDNFLENIFLKYYPGSDQPQLIYDIKRLRDYYSFFTNFHIKEVYLFFYLNDDFFTKNWDIYLIIRYPIDNFISIVKNFFRRKSFKLYNILRKITIYSKYLTNFYLEFFKIDPFGIITLAKDINPRFGPKPNNLWDIEEAFIYVWTIANYQAVKSVPKDNIIIYEKPETYKRLPFELKDPLRIKIYPKAREILYYEFEKIARRLEIEEEYNYLLKFFD